MITLKFINPCPNFNNCKAIDNLFKGIIGDTLYIQILEESIYYQDTKLIPIEEAVKQFIFPKTSQIVRHLSANFNQTTYSKIKTY